MHGKPGWEEPLVKIPKSYHNGVASLNISMRNLIIIIIIIITISFKEILETRNSLKNVQNREISWQNKRSGCWGSIFRGRVGEMEHICQVTNLIANKQLLKPFIEPILTNVLIWMIVVRFSWNFKRPYSSPHF